MNTLKLKQYMKMAAQNLFLPAVYRLNAKRPVQPKLVLFADAHHTERPESMELLYEELVRRGFTVEEMYLDYGKSSAGQTLKHMVSFMKRYALAQAVVICDNFLPAASCRKKQETVLVQLWHACGALKQFGYDTTEDIPANYRGNVFAGTDLVTVSAPFCVSPFTSAMRLPEGRVQALGVSRTDRLFDKAYISMCRERFEAAVGAELYHERRRRKVVLWAPTFRGNPGAPERLPLDLAALQKELGEEYLVMESDHPHMNRKMHLPLTTQEMLPSVDVLIADYSSLLFEYCLLDKPLVLYTPDFAEYTAKRGFYMPYGEIPGRQVLAETDLAEAVRLADAEGMDEEMRRRFLEKYMSSCDGQATRRIADRIETMCR